LANAFEIFAVTTMTIINCMAEFMQQGIEERNGII
jgi:hypothetical protein